MSEINVLFTESRGEILCANQGIRGGHMVWKRDENSIVM